MRTRPGRTALAAAAYRAARLLRRWLDGKIIMTHDFRAKHGVIASYILAPAGAIWALDRERLWNAAEDVETRKNSVTAREYEIAIPADLPESERVLVVRDFAQSLVDQFGVAVDVSLHAPSAAGDQRNYHAHLLATTRVVAADGLGAKTRTLDARGSGPKLVEEIRARWASLCNSALERAGSPTRLDHRSYARRAVARIPTLHNGHRVTALARQFGVATARFNENAAIREHNARLDALRVLLRATAVAPPAPALSPMRLTVPRSRLTRLGLRLTLPPSRLEIKNERDRHTTTRPAGPSHELVRSMFAQPNRDLDVCGPIQKIPSPDLSPLSQAPRDDLVVAGRPIRPNVRGLPPARDLHRVSRTETEAAARGGGVGRPDERGESSPACVPGLERPDVERPSDRIAGSISPGRRFHPDYAAYIDALVEASVAAKIAEYNGWLDRVTAAHRAVRAVRATGDPVRIAAVEEIVRAKNREKIPSHALILRNAEQFYVEKIRKKIAKEKDVRFDSTDATGARSSTKWKPMGPAGIS